MSLELIEKLLAQTQGRKMASLRPFVTGDPLVEPRMPEIIKLIKKYNPAEIVLYTNGTAYANREFLMLGLAEVHFTLSAATRETYEIVHGRDLYDQAVKTIEWLEQQPNHPRICVNFIITKENAFEIWAWMKKWRRFNQARNRAHGYLPTDPDAQFLKRIQIPDEITIPEDNIIGCNPELPCSFYNNAIITANGELKLCCLSGISFGNIKDEPLETLWRRRCQNKGENPDCRRCVFKGRNWDGWMKLIN
jgi:MoaA/NifB/PqqE/SkfB family radical SAM enzyme